MNNNLNSISPINIPSLALLTNVYTPSVSYGDLSGDLNFLKKIDEQLNKSKKLYPGGQMVMNSVSVKNSLNTNNH